MRLNRASESKVITILISREFPLFNIEHLDIWCAWIGHPSEKLWQFYFLESFYCLISSVSIYDAPESNIRVKIYHHLNFSRASVVQFRASRYIMCLNRTSEWKVMTISVSWELSLFSFERLDMWCSWIGPPCDYLWPFEFLESFHCSISSVSIYDPPKSDLRLTSYNNLNFSRSSVVQFRASPYVMCLNRTSLWKVMTIWISRELPLFNFEFLNIWCAWIEHPSVKLWQFQFLESFRFSTSSVSICDVPESNLRVKSYDHLNFSRDFVVQFRAAWYMMRLNRTSEWKFMII